MRVYFYFMDSWEVWEPRKPFIYFLEKWDVILDFIAMTPLHVHYWCFYCCGCWPPFDYLMAVFMNSCCTILLSLSFSVVLHPNSLWENLIGLDSHWPTWSVLRQSSCISHLMGCWFSLGLACRLLSLTQLPTPGLISCGQEWKVLRYNTWKSMTNLWNLGQVVKKRTLGVAGHQSV